MYIFFLKNCEKEEEIDFLGEEVAFDFGFNVGR